MKKILFLSLALPVLIFSHSHERIMQEVIEQSQKFLLDYEGSTVLLMPSYGLKKTGYRSFELHDIVAPGFYKIAGPISRKLTIASDNVTLDIGGQVMSGGLVVAANKRNITIQNGTVDIDGSSGDAIKVNSGCSGITLCDVAARNASGSGICFDTVRDSIIKNCDLSSNTTGVALESCANIVVQSCNAVTNRVTGFGMLTSTTCSFVACNALSTGDGNTAVLNNSVFGFVSNDGYGNIFERCIANSTQALSTTDYTSLVAGFALRGTEGCSRIIECEAGNSQTNSSGFTVPYGILLEDSVATLSLVVNTTATLSGPSSPHFSPDGQYFASISTGPQVIGVYKFDRTTLTNTFVAQTNESFEQFEPNWSPDGQYLVTYARGLTRTIYVYRFNSEDETLSVAATLYQPDVIAVEVNWSPDGQYLVLADQDAPTMGLVVYKFDRVAEAITLVAQLNTSTDLKVPMFSPDGNYILTTDTTNLEVQIYQFTSPDTLALFANSTDSLPNPQESGWSADGKYIALVDDTLVDLLVYEFDPDQATLTRVAQANDSSFLGNPVEALWSPYGYYISVGDSGTPNQVALYQFDPSTNTVTRVSSVQDSCTSEINWSPDGKYGVGAKGSDNALLIYQLLDFPSKNILKNNTTYCNSGGQFNAYGVGVSGSSIENLVIGNTSYTHPIKPFMVFQNYAFVTNVFNPLFNTDPGFATSFAGNGPPTLFNLSFAGGEPIAQVPDVQVQWLRALDKSCDIQTKVDLLLTLIP